MGTHLNCLTNICCGYSLELPHRGNSNDYPQHVFSDSFRIMKIANILAIGKDALPTAILTVRIQISLWVTAVDWGKLICYSQTLIRLRGCYS